jgi:hypothetical protein
LENIYCKDSIASMAPKLAFVSTFNFTCSCPPPPIKLHGFP